MYFQKPFIFYPLDGRTNESYNLRNLVYMILDEDTRIRPLFYFFLIRSFPASAGIYHVLTTHNQQLVNHSRAIYFHISAT